MELEQEIKRTFNELKKRLVKENEMVSFCVEAVEKPQHLPLEEPRLAN